MLWLNPFALFALALVAAPILIHILIRRRAEPFPFPTLRFLQPTRLAAIRRHVLEDIALLAVRIALLAATVAALAGPLFVTAARRQAWDRRIVRAVVVDDSNADLNVARPFEGRDRGAKSPAPQANSLAPHLQNTFEATSLTDGIRRAILWLDTAPPARRELVVASVFPIGSIAQADLSVIPDDIGVRFERTGTLPGTRTVAAGRLLTSGGVRAREVTLAGAQTSVRDAAVGDPMVWPIDVVSSKAEQPAIDAAVAAVLSQRAWAAPPDRRARLVLVEPTVVVQAFMPAIVAHPSTPAVAQALPRDVAPEAGVSPGTGVAQAFRPAIIDGLSDVSPVRHAWIADAVARIAGDRELRDAAAGVAAGLSDARLAAAPWQILASAADGRPLAVAAESANRLVVASAARASDVTTPLLLRAIANAIAVVPDLQHAEVVSIADALLRQWSRPSTPPASPRIETVDHDDRRWLWLAALCLLGLEMRIRRARPVDASQEHHEETAHVA